MQPINLHPPTHTHPTHTHTHTDTSTSLTKCGVCYRIPHVHSVITVRGRLVKRLHIRLGQQKLHTKQLWVFFNQAQIWVYCKAQTQDLRSECAAAQAPSCLQN